MVCRTIFYLLRTIVLYRDHYRLFVAQFSHLQFSIEVANLKRNGITTLAWDVGKEISKIFQFQGEIIVGRENEVNLCENGNYGFGYDHSYCLVFKKD